MPRTASTTRCTTSACAWGWERGSPATAWRSPERWMRPTACSRSASEVLRDGSAQDHHRHARALEHFRGHAADEEALHALAAAGCHDHRVATVLAGGGDDR